MTTAAEWIPVLLAGDVEPGSATGVRVSGRELVVWRDAAGVAHVWEDRCPHRGMRLSFGFVRGDRLACLYHGWQFDGAGRCRAIPAHPQLDVPATITATRYVSAEQGGLVWVSLDDAAPAAPAAPPPTGNEMLAPVRSVSIGAPADAVVAAIVADAVPLGDAPAAGWERAGSLLMRRSSPAVRVGVQPVNARETMLHIGVAPGAEAQRGSVSLWAQALRRHLEAQAAQASIAA